MVYSEKYPWRSRCWLNNILNKFLCREASHCLLFVTADCDYPRERYNMYMSPLCDHWTTLGGPIIRSHCHSSFTVPFLDPLLADFLWEYLFDVSHTWFTLRYILCLFPHLFSWIFPSPWKPLSACYTAFTTQLCYRLCQYPPHSCSSELTAFIVAQLKKKRKNLK